MRIFRNIFFSFPVQLLLMHFKRHHLLMVFWLILFLMISNSIGSDFGFYYLLLDPEYLGKVDFISFGIMGVAFGVFVMTWHITTYILESYRFPFLATFEQPFSVYCLNNSLLPLGFVFTYIGLLLDFERTQPNAGPYDTFLHIVGFLMGMLIIIVLLGVYFQTTNRNIFNVFSNKTAQARMLRRQVQLQEDKNWRAIQMGITEFRVDYYITFNLRIRHIRSIKHYGERVVREVFKQNHANAFAIELALVLFVIGSGFMIDYEVFRIPAAASAILFFAILVAFSGMLDFWLKGWKTFFIIITVIAVNFTLVKMGGVSYKNKAYGINYQRNPAAYTYTNLDRIASKENVERDIMNTIGILEAWKAHTKQAKPKLVLMCFSGGGSSAATFSTSVLQKADSMLNGKLMKHTVMMTGASGGMIGAAYFRELYLRKKERTLYHLYDPKYVDNISKDLLNSVIYTMVTNDMFYPFQTFSVGPYTYRKDRGYLFEKQLNENTDYLMSRNLAAYDQYEKAGVIPMMLFTPSIVNDQRRLYVSSQPVSYLMRPVSKHYKNDSTDIDGVDMGALLKEHDAYNLNLTTAIRMNATYPYVLPYVALPTKPLIKVMDAGSRDNYGIAATVRFVQVFKDWIKKNTSGVVIVQVRQYTEERELQDYETETLLTSFLTPITNLYGNLTAVQDYDHNYMVSALGDALDNTPLNVVLFQYRPEKREEETSLSFHLTSKEKSDIRRSVNQPNIDGSIEMLKYLLRK
ncbi:MAG: hypothetical protein SFW35_13705 [Chitinophagales bacterium]|nr:hypothetical protein [Chitinophagales bacterium]